MSLSQEKVAEVLALTTEERAFLARELIASLDPGFDSDAEIQWASVIRRRSEQIVSGEVSCRPVEVVLRELRGKLNAGHHPS